MLRKRVWLNTPWGTYGDRKKHLLTDSEIEQYKLYEENNIAFNYGDFINSVCVTKPNLSILTKRPNYLLLYNGNNIEARYYVMNYQYIAGEPSNENAGTYEATLYRDLIVDYKDDIKNNMFKCERGYLNRNVWSPILVQPEGLFLNKIKTNQIPIQLWDKNAQWLTIFYDTGREQDISIKFDQTNQLDAIPIADINSAYTSKGFQAPTVPNDTQIFLRNPFNVSFDVLAYCWNEEAGVLATVIKYRITISKNRVFYTVVNVELVKGPSPEEVNQVIYTYYDNIKSEVYTKQEEVYNIDKTDNFRELNNNYNNIIVQQSDNKLNRMKINNSGRQMETINLGTSDDVYNFIYNKTFDETPHYIGKYEIKFASGDRNNPAYNPSPEQVNMQQQLGIYNMQTTFTEAYEDIEILLPAKKTNYRLDETYLGCVTIPFGNDVKLINGNKELKVSEQIIKNLATEGWSLTGSIIKDIQILPYCPCNKLNQLYNNDNPNSNIDITTFNTNYEIPIKQTAENKVIYYGFVCDKSSMDYRYPINLSNYFGDDIKMDSITKSIRLCSQDHKQSFDMNPALNNGIESLSFECTIKPFNTVYHICPIFKELYGGNYEDVRGLVWEGGFSLSHITDQWTEYKLNNSTYKELFDRETKNYEINADLARQHETLNYEAAYEGARNQMIASTVRSGLNTAIGVASTAASGHPIAAIGTAIAGIANTAINVGTQIDSMNRNLEVAKKAQGLNDQSRAEGLAYKKDTFNLSNQAIQARPNSIASSTDYSVLNYYKAYIEIYDCTDIEKEFINKLLTYHGMKIGQIGFIKDYLTGNDCYIEGNLLFMQGVDNNVENAVNSELKLGIYVQEGLFN